jgi:poly-beta-1,6-N-acetyl-D-glucosamine N-deacetylase
MWMHDRPELWRIKVSIRIVLMPLILNAVLILLLYTAPAVAADHAVILMYHNISDEAPKSTSVTPAMFEKHMQYLEHNGYSVQPLLSTLQHLLAGESVPERTVVITFDDAYKSVYTQAWPRLSQRGWPFSVFVTTAYISNGDNNFMSWENLRELGYYGAGIGNHSMSHPHLVRKFTNESSAHWKQRVTEEVTGAQRKLHNEIGNPIPVFAYPYGEFTAELKMLLSELGYFGLGQQSGAVAQYSDFQELPRFPMATGFDDMDDFAIKIAARPLPVTVISPLDHVLPAATDIPELHLFLEPGNYDAARLACYASGQGHIQVEWVDRDAGEVKVRANEALVPGRAKYNCTAPATQDNGIYYWYSHLWMKPEADGS